MLLHVNSVWLPCLPGRFKYLFLTLFVTTRPRGIINLEAKAEFVSPAIACGPPNVIDRRRAGSHQPYKLQLFGSVSRLARREIVAVLTASVQFEHAAFYYKM